MLLDASAIESLVIPWVQEYANGGSPDPALTLADGWIVPTGGAWQAGAWVLLAESGVDFTISAHYDGVDFTATVQQTER